MRIAALTSGRQDWGIIRSTCRALREHDDFDLRLIAGGMACAKDYGNTEALIASEGFAIAESLPWIDDISTPAPAQAGRALELIAGALGRQSADALVIVGDRFETAAAAMAATLQRIPIVHLHGGEETEGAFDNAMRHAITKLSHLHLVSHDQHRRRVIAMGEDPGAVHVVGAPGLDNLRRDDLAGREELEAFLGIELEPPVVVVTVHPTTLGLAEQQESSAVLEAMDRFAATYVVTLPNTDPGHIPVRQALVSACDRPRRVAVNALGERRYFGLLRLADALLGNSSSAIIEAPAIGLPAVNVGDRQKGRLRGDNVLDVPADPDHVTAALERALAPAFRELLEDASPLFGDGRSAARIVEVLERWSPTYPPRKPAIPI